MGWREYLVDCVVDASWRDGEPHAVPDALMEMPASDRIALARELLAGTGRVVARDVDDQEWSPPTYGDLPARTGPWVDGWNACRTAMLADGAGDG